MGRVIKFYLKIGEKQIKSLEELKENFVIDDIYEYHKNQVLQKWLRSLGHKDVAAQLDKVSVGEDPTEELKQIMEIFAIEHISQRDIEDSIAAYSFEIDRNQLRQLEEEKQRDHENHIAKYFSSYENLCQRIIDNYEDFESIKNHVNVILADYMHIFKLNYRQFYDVMIEKCPLAIFAVLGNLKGRDYFFAYKHEEMRKLDYMVNKKLDPYCFRFDNNIALRCVPLMHLEESTQWSIMGKVHKVYDKEIKDGDPFFSYRKYIKSHGELTDSSDYIKLTDKNVVLLYCPERTKVRAINDSTIWHFNEINGCFPLLKGLLYSSRVKNDHLKYIEI
jgi:hypothetical protein